MPVYKITFVYNQIARISLARGEHIFEGDYYYHVNQKGFLIYALVKAYSEKHAAELAREIINKVNAKNDSTNS